jgi:hypothetical protein
MRLAFVAFVASAAFGACSPSPLPPASPAAPTAPPLCERVADHLVSLIGEPTHATSEQLDPFRRVVSTRCLQDQWSAQAQQCLLDAKTLSDGDRCGSLFTPDQKQALDRDGQAAVTGMQPAAAAPAAKAGAAPAPAEEAAPAAQPRKTGDPDEGGQ